MMLCISSAFGIPRSVAGLSPNGPPSVFAMNVMLRFKGKSVRAAIRADDAIERIARENGLAPLVAKDVGHAWRVALFHRT